MKCISCGEYFKRNRFNAGFECEGCVDLGEPTFVLDSEGALEVDLLKNPSGRTQPVFYEDRDDDSHGF